MALMVATVRDHKGDMVDGHVCFDYVIDAKIAEMAAVLLTTKVALGKNWSIVVIEMDATNIFPSLVQNYYR